MREKSLTQPQIKALSIAAKTDTSSDVDIRAVNSLRINKLIIVEKRLCQVTKLGKMALEDQPHTEPPSHQQKQRQRGRPHKTTPKNERHYRVMLSEEFRAELDSYCSVKEIALSEMFRSAAKITFKDLKAGKRIDFTESETSGLTIAYPFSMTPDIHHEVSTYCKNGPSMAAFFRVSAKRLMADNLSR